MGTPEDSEKLTRQWMDGMNRFSRFVDEFKLESDRGAAILPLCVIEQMLREGIALRLVVSDGDTMRRLAQSGSTTNIALTARAIGLISQAEFECVNALGAIRNKFAHAALEKLSFESEVITPLLAKLNPPIPFNGLENESPRNKFLIVAAILFGTAFIRHSMIQRITPPVVPVFPAPGV